MLKFEEKAKLAVFSIGDTCLDHGRADFDRLYSPDIPLETCSKILNAPKRIRALFAEFATVFTSASDGIKQELQGLFSKLQKSLEVQTAQFEEGVALSAGKLRNASNKLTFANKESFLTSLNTLIAETEYARYQADLPKITADGMFRAVTYYSPPGALIGMRKEIKQRPELFDVIVIGGGE